MNSTTASRWPLARVMATALAGLLVMVGAERGWAVGSGQDGRATDNEIAADGGDRLPYVPHQLVVKLRNGASGASTLTDAAVLSIRAQLEHANVYLLELEPDASIGATAATFQAEADVEYAQPNYVLNWAHPVQASYPFSDLQATGDYAGQYASSLLDLGAAHALATGAGVHVAIVDGGIDFTHPGLDGRAVSGYDFVDADADAFDEGGGLASGHGTFVAGAVHLVAPDAQLTAYRIMNANGYGDGFTLAQAIERAVDDGSDVINLSVVLTHQHLAVEDALNYAEAEGVIVTAAAGNAGKDLAVYPAAEPAALAVAAVDSLAVRAGFSNVGSFVDLCAPGTDIYSAFQDDLFAWWSGTSFSAPMVAGAAALLKGLHPSATVSQLTYALKSTATNLDAQNPALTGKLGAGMVNPYQAVALLSDFESATVTPDTLRFTVPQGVMWLVLPRDSVFLSSTNAPADFYVRVLPDSIHFVTPIDTIGTTDRWVAMYLDPLPWLGEFTNTLDFYVEGAVEPARLVVIQTVVPVDSLPWAYADPGSLAFTVPLGSDTVITVPVVIHSSNAPAAFTAAIAPGGAGLTDVVDSSGITDDSMRVQVEPARAFSAGLYVDQVEVLIDGVEEPLTVPVYVNIVDSTVTTDTAWVVPDTGLTLVAADLDTLYACVSIQSSNPGANYFVEVADNPDFIHLTDSVGATPGVACFTAIANLAPGIYADTLLFYVDGTANSPVPAVVTLLVDSLGGGGSPDTAASPSVIIDYPYAAVGNQVNVNVRSLASGLAWGGFDFRLQFDTQRLTLVSASAGDFLNGCGWEYFNLGSDTSSGTVHLVGVADLVAVPGSPACLTPDSGAILARLTFQVTGDSSLSCAAAPVRFFWTDCGDNMISNATGDSVFLAGNAPWSVIDHTGYDLTGQPAIGGPPWPCPADSATTFAVTRFHDGAVWISCDTTVTPGDSAYVVPSVLSYDVAAGSSDTIMACALVWSDNAPAGYFAEVIDQGEMFTAIPDSVGQTPDSLCVLIDPSGLAPGMHVDTIAVDIAGVATPRWLFIQLSVQGAAAISQLVNYPNPFNPRTEISFRQATAMPVRLEVFNVLGQHVVTLFDGMSQAGDHRYIWEGTDDRGRPASSGVYFYRLTAGTEGLTGKLMLLR